MLTSCRSVYDGTMCCHVILRFVSYARDCVFFFLLRYEREENKPGGSLRKKKTSIILFFLLLFLCQFQIDNPFQVENWNEKQNENKTIFWLSKQS